MSTTRQFKTDLRCGSCVATVKPYLDRVPGVDTWDIDVASPNKTLTISGMRKLAWLKRQFHRPVTMSSERSCRRRLRPRNRSKLRQPPLQPPCTAASSRLSRRSRDAD